MKFKTANRLKHIEEYYFSRKLRQLEQMRQQGTDVINLGIGSPDQRPPQKVIEVLHQTSNEDQSHGYQSYKGIPELRESFARWYKNHFNVALDAHTQILPLIGSKEGIMHISITFLEVGDKVLVPNPGYPAYGAAARIAGAEVVEYTLTEASNWLPDLEEIEAAGVKVMWLNYPHMPSGAAADHAFFKKIVQWAKQNHILLCHDNPYSFIMNDAPLSILSVPGAIETAIELTSLSKSYNMAGWRVGAMAGREDLLQEVLKFKSNMDSGMFKPVQLAAVEAMNAPQDWFEQLNSEYRHRRNIVEKIFQLLNCKVDNRQVGLFLWGRNPDNETSSEAISERILHATGVFITPGFIFGSGGDRYLRISLCSPPEVMRKALNRVERFVEQAENVELEKETTGINEEKISGL